MADDPDMAEAHLAPCVTHFRAAANPIGRRRCDRLLGQIRDHRSHNDREHEQRTFKDLEAKVQAAAAGCTSLTDKATAMLQLLLSETCAEGGMLRAFGGTGENETVAQGLGERGEEVSSLLEQLSTDFDDEDDEMGTITSTHTESSAAEFETRYQPILLRPPGDQRAVGVAVLLLPPGERFRDMGTLATLIGRSLVQSED